MCPASPVRFDPVVLAAFQVSSGWGLVLSIVILTALGILWLVSLFLLVADSISVFAKIVWAVLLIVVAPVAIPVYLLLRHHRRTHRSYRPNVAA